MADDDFETPEIWDEYQWERFLQQQDRNTEKYFGLLEKYLDHPDRDNIIAKEMGWESFDEERDAEWDEVAESLCEALGRLERCRLEFDLPVLPLEEPAQCPDGRSRLTWREQPPRR